jgi:hypothetical protein
MKSKEEIIDRIKIEEAMIDANIEASILALKDLNLSEEDRQSKHFNCLEDAMISKERIYALKWALNQLDFID